MKKIIIIGCPGAGKSTFARKLRDKLRIELYHLDKIYHKSDKTSISRKEFDDKLAEIMKKDQWIIDGNYQRTIPSRLEYCDTVFLLDYPLDVCLAGAKARVGIKREDMPWVEEKFDPEFKEFIMDFAHDQLPAIYRMLEKHSDLNIHAVANPGIAYIASKRANHLRVRTAAATTWGDKGARINTLSPGIIVTPLAYDEFNAAGEGYQKMIDSSPMKRVGTIDEIAAAGEFLLSDKATFITGTDLLIDGGVIAAMNSGRFQLG